MDKTRIEVVIDSDGNLKSTVLGVDGPACEVISEFLKELGQVVTDKKTPDYYKTAKQTNQLTTKR